ncbi:potassium channel family protein [Limisalsivibrio acetivorans]|uniref:potassium channel family protein n=1 Tax=Limisalsivibrio acetivorans TaxID=1304888 RepID=UPI0003B31690|nr:potassium channel protein [Limisalsivibrio acetivorans]
MAEKDGYRNVKPVSFKRIYEEKLYDVLGNLRLPLMTVIFFTTIGVLSLMIINKDTDGKSVLNYLFHTLITFSTIGFTEGYNSNITMNRVFMVVFVMLAFPLVYFYGLAATVQVLLQGDLRSIYRYWRKYSKMEQLKNHFIICGYNDTTKEIIRNFRRRGIPFIVACSETSCDKNIENSGVEFYVFAEPHRRDVLLGLNIDDARGLITAYEEGTTDIAVIVTARLLRPDKDNFTIYATALSEYDRDKMKLLGANEVIVPAVTTGRRILSYVLHPPSPVLSGFLEKIAYGERTDIDIIELQLSESSDVTGKALKETGVRENTGATIVAISNKEGKMKVAPPGDIVLKAGYSLILLGTPSSLNKAKKLLAS